MSANNIYEGKYFCRALDPQTYNVPETYGILIAIVVTDDGSAYSGIQFFAKFSSDNIIYARNGYSGSGKNNISWGSWGKIKFE